MDRREILAISDRILTRAEQERIDVADKEAAIGVQYDGHHEKNGVENGRDNSEIHWGELADDVSGNHDFEGCCLDNTISPG